MKDKGKGVASNSAVTERSIIPSLVVENSIPISALSAIFDEDVLMEDMGGDDDIDDDDDDDEEDEEEDKDDKKTVDDEKVFSASSHSSDNDDDDNQGGAGITMSEASKYQNADDYMNDEANEEIEEADGKGEHGDDQNVDQVEMLILRLEPHVEEGEFRHTYTLSEILKITHIDENEFKFDFEEELNAFDINHQREYKYSYVEDADVYDRVEVEDCTDEENVTKDTSEFPTLMKFFTEENRDELQRKIDEILKDKSFDGTTKDPLKEERKKWFKESNEVNAYAIRRECGVQYFEKLHVVMSLPWWDVDELSKVRTLGYPVRHNDIAMWGLIKFEALKNFKHWKPHYPKRV
ncbi:hypothetical protein Hanom_Chr05g00417451 [Helianthus anomalus]